MKTDWILKADEKLNACEDNKSHTTNVNEMTYSSDFITLPLTDNQ